LYDRDITLYNTLSCIVVWSRYNTIQYTKLYSCMIEI